MLLLPGQQLSGNTFVTTVSHSHISNSFKNFVPKTNDSIVGKITKVSSKYVVVDWGQDFCPTSFYKGTLRVQDIFIQNDTNPSGPLYEIFSIGQAIQVKIIGYGDSSTGFFLSYRIQDSLE